MSKEVQNSIEELVNSSLDIAAEEVMEDADTTVDSELEAIEDNGLTEPEELDLNTVKDIEDIEVQIEPDSELEDKIDSVLDEAIDDEVVDTEIDVMPTEELAVTDLDESVPVESIEALENEVSELETEIQTQMDSLVVKADHLKNSIQSEIQRVSDKNEELQIQVTQLEKQLLESEGKVEALVEVQDRQQETIKKLIRILKGVNTKITHLYDSKD